MTRNPEIYTEKTVFIQKGLRTFPSAISDLGIQKIPRYRGTEEEKH
jgi:hypothetical protein